MKPEKVFRIGSVTASVFVNEIETDAGHSFFGIGRPCLESFLLVPVGLDTEPVLNVLHRFRESNRLLREGLFRLGRDERQKPPARPGSERGWRLRICR